MNTNQKLLDMLSKEVSGHMEAKKSLINLLNRSRLRHYNKYLSPHPVDDIAPYRCLLIGESGTGKTHLIRSLEKIATFPLVCIDATQLIPSGASGGLNLKGLKNLIKINADELVRAFPEQYYSLEAAIDLTVVFIDEIDKISKPSDSTGNWNKQVQYNFLTIMDGMDKYSGVSFVLAGAFSEMEKNKPGNSIGFNHHKNEDVRSLIDEDIIKYGLIAELVGRMTSIVCLDKFSEDDYLDILHKRLIPKKARELKLLNVKYSSITLEEKKNMCNKAYKSGQGIRALQRLLDKYFLDREFSESDCMIL